MAPQYAQTQNGFTYLELMVVLSILAILIIAIAPSVDQRIQDARITAMVDQMQRLAEDAEIYSMGLRTAAFDSDGRYVRTTRNLPASGSSQVGLFNAQAGTEYPSKNIFGQRFYLRNAAADRVFVTTRVPKARVGANFGPVGAEIDDLGSTYRVTVMAPNYGQRHYTRRSRTIKRFLEERNR